MNRTAPRRASLPQRLAWIFATVLLLASACGSDDATSSPTPAPATDAISEAPAATQAPTTTTEAAAEGPADTAAAADEASEAEPAPDEPEYRYQRIVSISPTGTEIAYAIGAGDRFVAVDEYSYYPEGTPVTDLSGWNPNIEAIVSYDPDLVIMGTDGDVIASLESTGIDVLVHDPPITFDDVYAQIAQFGETLDLVDQADLLVSDMQERIGELIATAPDASELSYYHELDNTLYTVTSATFIGHVYGLFGLENVADPADSDGSAYGYPQLSDEYLVDANPDVIFLADTLCCGQNAETVAARPGWDQLAAVQTGRVVELNDDIVSRWGPRLVEFIEAISEVLVSIGDGG